MGVPKFFRYMSERYPCLSELIKEYEIPEFDNMYLDMNGIIHVCSHPNDSNPHFRITEEKIFEDIFKYIEVLFRLIQPKQLFFMAVDGVAPRAKMNHQRGRRFRSAKDAETAESLAVSKGEKLPEEKRFDSNCITPGTEFMVKLQKQLQLFVNRKITQDKMWRKVKIILSGHECPGEGEHKIMDYIRFMKSQPDYNPNTRHCIYGLDADLIMLGLCTHEPYFSLLREEVKFGKQNNMRCMSAEEINFYLLHLSVMRDYLDLEFQELKETLPFPYDLECVINDWVLMGFLVGNDFIPHLPNFHIANGALPILYNAYKSVLPTLDGYLNEEGTLNLKRFEAFLKKLSEYDEEAFREKSADLKWLDGKRTRALKPFDADELDEDSPDVFDDPELAALVKAADEFDDEEMDENAIFDAEFYADKKDYYLSKMGIEMNEESIKHQAAVYVGAIQWNLHYYYDGCCSWSWYYPYHYAPYVSDVANFSSLELKFDLSVPFLPFEQLLAVLPPASKMLLPAPYQRLMTEQTSPIIEYYPEDFETDLNGKKQDWEAVVLLPFIDEKSLKAAMRLCESELSVDERKRNSHGPMYIYTYSKDGSERPSDYNGPLQPRVKVEMKRRDEILVEKSKLVKGICKGINLGAFMFGFPNLRHVKFNASLEKAKVMVFEQPSRNENMILNVEKPQQIPLKDIADKVVNQIIFVDWPFLAPAKVSQIMTEDEKYYLESNGKICMQKMTKPDVEAMKLCIHTVENRYKNKKGINVGSTDILVFAHRLIGQKRVFTKQGLVSFEREFDSNGSYYVHQVLVNDVASSNEFGKAHYKSLGEVFMPNSECFMLGHPHYGSLGKVVEVSKTGRVKIDVVVNGDPNLENARKNSDNLKNSYMKPHQAAARLSISTLLLSRITGTILVVKPSSEDGGDERIAKSFESKVNIGLNLKLTKKNEVVPGYVRKSFNGWVYSPKAVDLIVTYMRKFPSIFEQLNKNEGNDIYKMNDLFPDAQDQTEQLKLVTDWLKSEPFSSIPRMSCNSEFLETEIITDIYNSVNDFQSSKQKKKSVVLEVKPHLLYQPVEKLDVKLPDPSAEFHLFDRVVCIRESFSVPLGLKGTITGIQRDKADCETKDSLIIVLFDKDFVDDESLDPLSRRSHRVHAQGLINISHGDRIGNKNTVSKPISVADKMEGSWRQNSSQSAFAAVDSQTSNTPQNTHNKSRGGFYDNTGPRYPNNDSFRNNSYHNAPPQTGEMFFKNSKNVSRTDKTYTPKMVTEFFKQPTEKASTVTSNKSDFQGMWQELKKAGNTKSPASPAMDPSNALKKMLQIADAPKALTTLRPESHSLVNPGQTSKISPINPMKQVFINSAYQHHQMPSNFMQNMQSLPIQSIPMQSMPIQSMPVQSLPMQSNHGFRNQGPFGFQPKVDSNPRNGHIANSPLRPPSFPTNFPPPPQIAPLQVAFGKNAPIAPAVVPNFPPPPRMEQSKPADAGPLAAFSNPFVPLQVTRKQVTNIGNTEGSSGTFQITEQSAGQNSKSSNGMINPLVANPSTSNPEVSKPRRSRIAAKFAAPLDSKN